MYAFSINYDFISWPKNHPIKCNNNKTSFANEKSTNDYRSETVQQAGRQTDRHRECRSGCVRYTERERDIHAIKITLLQSISHMKCTFSIEKCITEITDISPQNYHIATAL